MFLVLVAGWTLLFAHAVAPAIVSDVPVPDLPDAARNLTYLWFAGTSLCGVLGGISVSFLLRRNRRPATVAGAAAGVAGAVLLLVGASYLGHQPLVTRSVEANAVAGILGAILGAAVGVTIRGRGQPARSPQVDRPRVAAVMPLAVVLGVAHLVVAGPLAAVGSSAAGSSAAGSSAAVASAVVRAAEATDPDIPTDDCALTSQEIALSAGFTLFSIDVGGSWTATQKTTRREPAPGAAPGSATEITWEDEVDVGLKAGVKFSLGEHIGASFLGGEGLSASVSADATSDVTNTYGDLTQSEAGAVTRWSLVRYATAALSLPGLSTLGVRVASPHTPAPKAPTATEFQVGGKVEFSIKLGVLVSYSYTFDVAGKIGVQLTDERNENVDGIDHPTGLDVLIDLSSESKGQAQGPIVGMSGDLEGGSVLDVAISKNADGSLGLAVGLESTYALLAGADFDVAGKDLLAGSAAVAGKVGALLSAFKSTSSDERGGSLEVKGEVDQLDSTNLPVLNAARRVLAAYQQAHGPDATAQDRAELTAANGALSREVDQRATVRVKGYDVVTGTAGVDLEVGDGVSFGASAEAEATAEKLVGAWYRNAAHEWDVSATCHA